MNTEQWKERWHDIKDRVMHPWGKHPHEELEKKAEGLVGPHGEHREEEHKTDDIAGSD